MSGKSFIEWVSISAREPVFSAALAWVLSEDSPLPLDQRLSVLGSICGARPVEGRSITCTTEYEHIDVLVIVERPGQRHYIGIENKIKAVEGKNQLAVYDRHLDALAGCVERIFLTLTGERPVSGRDWKAVSYSTVADALRRQPGASNPLVSDLCNAMTRLAKFASAARTEEVVAAVAFGDPQEAKDHECAAYVNSMRLHKVAQRIWMSELALRLSIASPWRVKVDETHGQALLEVKAALRQQPGYVVGLQIQNRAIKAFCAPNPYPKSASKEQDRAVQETLKEMSSALGLDESIVASSSRGRGFRSFAIERLPDGRDQEEWAKCIAPYLRRLLAAFPKVSASVGD